MNQTHLPGSLTLWGGVWEATNVQAAAWLGDSHGRPRTSVITVVYKNVSGQITKSGRWGVHI